jgi:hypothetical protein
MRIAIVLLLVSCGSRDDGPHTWQPGEPAYVTGTLDPKIPFGNELSIQANHEITDDLRRALETGMRSALVDAAACMQGIYGTAPFEMVFDATGKVTKSKVTSGLLQDTPIAACIETAFAKLQLGPVKGSPLVVHYPVRNMPNAEQLRGAAEIIKGSL